MICPYCHRRITLALIKPDEAAMHEYAETRLSGGSEREARIRAGVRPTPPAQGQPRQAQRPAGGDKCRQCTHWKSRHRIPGSSPAEYGECQDCGCEGYE